jgi:hypothetical protein
MVAISSSLICGVTVIHGDDVRVQDQDGELSGLSPRTGAAERCGGGV